MKPWFKMVFSALLVLVAVPALAACPVEGDYRSLDGTMALGRYAEGWCANPAGFGNPGNTADLMSWDLGVLGGQWRFWGMTIDANGAVLVGSFMTPQGNGWKDYAINYTGGQFWLDGSHPWSSDGNDLTGTLTGFSVSIRLTYLANHVDGATSNISMTGAFDGCPDCIFEYVLADGLLVWLPGWANMPAGYPTLPCGANLGELHDVCAINARLTCGVATESQTWGNVKALYW